MSEPNDPPATPTAVEYHHTFSRQFRVIHCDGMFGGLTPTARYLQVAFYSERTAIPDSMRNSVSAADGGVTVGAEIPGSRAGKTGIEREFEADVRMDIETAKRFYQWMRRHLQAANVNVEELERNE